MDPQLDAASAARLAALNRAPLDRWVALSADESRIVAEGHTFEEVAAAAEQQGERDPLLIRIPEDWNPRPVDCSRSNNPALGVQPGRDLRVMRG